MFTLRQLERLWQQECWQRIVQLCMDSRLEASPRLNLALSRPVSAAAVAFLRLDELGQPHVPFCAQMVRVMLAAQEADGGWGDPLTSALCVRALMASHGAGPAVEQGLHYLAHLQKTEGLWPKIPVRRLPADAFLSAFILYQLGEDSRFQQAVRLDEAIAWFERHQGELDAETARLWKAISLRHRPAARPLAAAHWS